MKVLDNLRETLGYGGVKLPSLKKLSEKIAKQLQNEGD